MIAQLGLMPCNRFLIGKTGTWSNATAASRKIDAAASLRQVVRAEAAALVQYWHPGQIDYGCVSFLAARIPAAAVSPSHMYAPFFVVP